MTTRLYETYGAVAQSNDVYFTHLARNLAIKWACRVGSAACQSDAAEIMADHYKTGTEIDKNLVDIFACAGFRSANETYFDIVFDQLKGVASTATRTAAINTLLCTYNSAFLETILSRTIEENSDFLDSERVYVLEQMVKRDLQSLEITLAFMKNNSELLKALVSVADTTSIFNQMATASYSSKLAPTIRELAKEFENNLGSEVMANIDAQLDGNLAWMAQQGDVVIAFVSLEDETDGGGANSIVVSSALVVVAVIMSFFRM